VDLLRLEMQRAILVSGLQRSNKPNHHYVFRNYKPQVNVSISKEVLLSIRDDFLEFSKQAFLSAERVVPISKELREQRLSHRV
jgi:hypothetical protein